MDLALHDDPVLVRALSDVRERLLRHPELVASELDTSSGIIVASRRDARRRGSGRGMLRA
jgi:hypothetical protein